jgi:sulfur relay (sulfurtransferase) DsrC/TusE family protein
LCNLEIGDLKRSGSRHVIDFMVKQQGIEKKFAKEQLFRMFPYGYVKQTCRIAGMQRPRAWSTG